MFRDNNKKKSCTYRLCPIMWVQTLCRQRLYCMHDCQTLLAHIPAEIHFGCMWWAGTFYRPYHRRQLLFLAGANLKSLCGNFCLFILFQRRLLLFIFFRCFCCVRGFFFLLLVYNYSSQIVRSTACTLQWMKMHNYINKKKTLTCEILFDSLNTAAASLHSSEKCVF